MLPGDLDVIVRRFGHEELARDLHLGRLSREVAQEATFLLDQKELGQLLGLGLQNLDPFLEFGDEVVKLHGAGNAEVEICRRRGNGEGNAEWTKGIINETKNNNNQTGKTERERDERASERRSLIYKIEKWKHSVIIPLVFPWR